MADRPVVSGPVPEQVEGQASGRVVAGSGRQCWDRAFQVELEYP